MTVDGAGRETVASGIFFARVERTDQKIASINQLRKIRRGPRLT